MLCSVQKFSRVFDVVSSHVVWCDAVPCCAVQCRAASRIQATHESNKNSAVLLRHVPPPTDVCSSGGPARLPRICREADQRQAARATHANHATPSPPTLLHDITIPLSRRLPSPLLGRTGAAHSPLSPRCTRCFSPRLRTPRYSSRPWQVRIIAVLTSLEILLLQYRHCWQCWQCWLVKVILASLVHSLLLTAPAHTALLQSSLAGKTPVAIQAGTTNTSYCS